jgi:ribosome biogenesis GTPase / thiamine phosphate phosphatase
LTRQRHLRIAPPVAGTTPAPEAARPPSLADLGWDDRWAAARRDHLADLAYQSVGYGPVAPGPVDPDGPPGSADWLPGRVTRADRGRARVATAAGEVRAAPLHPAITTGDWVLLDPAASGPAPVRAVLPRRTALIRGGGRKDASAQVLAANVDVVLVTVALTSAPDAGRLDRLLAVAWNSGAQPIVLLTKADLSRTADSERDEIAEASPATPVILTSTVDGRGVAELRGHLSPGRTMAFLGVSGAGKSSLVNALAGSDVAAVAPIRADGKGRHTTTARELVVLPGVGILLDTPGLRGVQLWAASDGLEQTFADVAELADQCRYRDCRHATEPDCAIAAAVEDGRLTGRRVDSYLRLLRENAWLQRRYDARLRAEQRRQWRQHARWVRDRRGR